MRKILRQSHKPRNNQICLFLKGDKEEKKERNRKREREKKRVCEQKIKRSKERTKGYT